MGLSLENVLAYTSVTLTGRDAAFCKMEKNTNTFTVIFTEEIDLTAGANYELIFS